MVYYSEPLAPRPGNAILRWALAPFGAAAASGFAALTTYTVFAIIYGAEAKKGGAPSIVFSVVALVVALVGWTWAGSRIAPPAHRRLALGLFSTPVVVMTMLFVIGVRVQDHAPPKAIGYVVGLLLGCAGILLLAFHPRFAGATAARREMPRPEQVLLAPTRAKAQPLEDEAVLNFATAEPVREVAPPPPVVEQQAPQVASPAPTFKPRSTPAAATSFGTRNRAAEAPRRLASVSRARSRRPIAALIDPTRQSEVAADLAAYFGPKSEFYLDYYARMVREQKLAPMGWHWPAFFGVYLWFFYRRLYVLGFASVVVTIIGVTLLPTGSVWAISVLAAIQAKAFYVQQGLRHILRADEMRLDGDARFWFLRSKGGVSRPALISALILLSAVVFLVAFVAGFIEAMESDQLARVRNA